MIPKLIATTPYPDMCRCLCRFNHPGTLGAAVCDFRWRGTDDICPSCRAVLNATFGDEGAGASPMRFAICQDCGGPLFAHVVWDHTGGTPYQDHEGEPEPGTEWYEPLSGMEGE